MPVTQSPPSLDSASDSGELVYRSAVLAEPGKVAYCNAPVEEPACGMVRVRIESCGVCASNVEPWLGRPWFQYPFEPGAPGHEATGRVDAVGPGVSEWQIGDRVAALSYHAFAEFDFAPADHLIALPPELADVDFPGEPLGCAMNIFRRSCVREGDCVAIVGVGFLGALLIQLAREAGAHVIALARRDFALDMAQSFGAHAVRIREQTEALREVTAWANDRLCDVVIEATGRQSPLQLAAELTRERGRLVIAGYHQDGPREINMQLWNWRGLDVFNAHERDPEVYLEGMRLAVEAVQSGRLNPMPSITHRLPLDQLGHALDLTHERPDGFMKALIIP